MKVDFMKICHRCFKMVDDDKLFGFKIVDDFGNTIGIQGHEECVQEMADLIRDEYSNSGKLKEEDSDE